MAKVAIPVRVAGVDLEAVLVPEMRVQSWFAGGEADLRLPEPAAPGLLVAPAPNPPTDAIFEILAEDRDVADQPLYRARLADQNSAPVVAARRQAEEAAVAARAVRPAEDGLERLIARRREQAARIVGALDDDELRALLDLLEGDLNQCLLTKAARQRLTGAVAA